MIESPEIEVVRRELERDVIGRRVKAITVLSGKVAPEQDGAELNERLQGARIVGEIARQGLQLLVTFDNGELMAIVLGTGGNLRRHPSREPVDPHTRLVIAFTQHRQELRLLDFKEGARLRLVTPEYLAEQVPAGIDPLQASLSWTDFSNLLLSVPEPVHLKAFLTSDATVVGVGDMYADEILFNAGLRHDRMTDSLGRQEVRRLWRAIVEILHDAVKYRGSTVIEESGLPGNHHVLPFGEPGQYQNHHNVFRRDGQLSPRSRRPIARTKYRGRWTYYCEQSQV
jgi:formamidopyrimidine-DNA glycosylase